MTSAVIGAGSVVTRDIAERVLAVVTAGRVVRLIELGPRCAVAERNLLTALHRSLGPDA